MRRVPSYMRRFYTRWLLFGGMLAAGWLCATFALADTAYNMRDNDILHGQRGDLYFELGRYEEAIQEYKIALDLNPNSALSAAIYNNLGVSYRKTANFPLAIASFQRAIRIQPTFEVYYKNLVETYEAGGYLTTAREALERLLALNPRDAEGWFLMGLLQERTGNPDEAKRAFTTFLRLEPHSQLSIAASKHL